MLASTMHSGLLRHGFVLILLGLLSGLLIPVLTIPRLGLSAHTIGVLGGVLLIVVAVVWERFSLTPRQASVARAAWLVSSYGNWGACLLGAALGAGRMTPVASAGRTAGGLAEGLVTGLLLLVALTSFIAVGLSLWGLRPSGVPRRA